jgi:hypothetical protein
MRTGWVAVVLGLLLALPGAAAGSGVPSAGGATVTGRVRLPDGRPAAGVALTFTGVTNGGDLLEQAFTGLMSFGAVTCPRGACTGGARARTRADGSFRVALDESTTHDADALRDVIVTASLPAGAGRVAGPALAATFQAAGPARSLGDLRLWDPALRLTPDGANLRAEWDPVGDLASGEATYHVDFTDPAGGDRVTFGKAHSPARVDRRALEDRRAVATVTATGHSATAPDVKVRWTSAGFAAPPAPRSLARGRRCRVMVGRAARTYDPCWATDGTAAHAFPGPVPRSCRVAKNDFGSTSEYCVVAPVESVTVDLGAVVPLDWVALSFEPGGEYVTAAVDVSTDGHGWREWTTVSPSRDRLDRYAGRTAATARFLRVRAGDRALTREDAQQPVYDNTIGDDGLVEDSPPRPPGRRVPSAEVKVWHGTLVSLREVVVLGPVAAPAPLPSAPRSRAAAPPGDSAPPLTPGRLLAAGGAILAVVALTLGAATAVSLRRRRTAP